MKIILNEIYPERIFMFVKLEYVRCKVFLTHVYKTDIKNIILFSNNRNSNIQIFISTLFIFIHKNKIRIYLFKS